jgi:hypothetical protein
MITQVVEVEKEVTAAAALPGPTQEPQPASATAVPAPSPGEAVQAAFSQLSSGRILYNPPERMTAGQRERVEVRVTQSMTESLTEGLRGSGPPRVEPIRVSSFMKVRLTGGGFEIVPLSSEEQIVLVGEPYTQWAWDVIPIASGNQTLVLVVTARVKVPGLSDEQKDLDIIERRIAVKVNAAYALSRFVDHNSGWLIPSVVVPVAAAAGGWTWRTIKRRRRPPPA